MEGGNDCTICQDRLSDPVILRCNHIFCEDCVSEWLDRESTCPLCRAIVPKAGKLRFSDGNTSMIPQLF